MASKPFHHKALPLGSQLREWVLEEVLGAGGFAIVYRGRGKYFGEAVAIKEYFPSGLAERIEGQTVVPSDSSAEDAYRIGLSKFVDEARILWNLSSPKRHPNIIGVRSLFEVNNTAYMVMDYEDGLPMSRLLRAGYRLNQAQLDQIFLPIVDGLKHAHAAGVYHRDIKPANILLDRNDRPVLIDFGSAKFDFGRGTNTRLTFYTPPYAAIEQYVRTYPQGPWTDIYALAVTLYQFITGEKCGDALERAHSDRGKPLAEGDWPGFSPEYLRAVDAGMGVLPTERPQSLSDWIALFPPPEAEAASGTPGLAGASEGPIIPLTLRQQLEQEPTTTTTMVSASSAMEPAGRSEAPPAEFDPTVFAPQTPPSQEQSFPSAPLPEAPAPLPSMEAALAVEPAEPGKGGAAAPLVANGRKAGRRPSAGSSGRRPPWLLLGGAGAAAVAVAGAVFLSQRSPAPPAPPVAAPIVSAPAQPDWPRAADAEVERARSAVETFDASLEDVPAAEREAALARAREVHGQFDALAARRAELTTATPPAQAAAIVQDLQQRAQAIVDASPGTGQLEEVAPATPLPPEEQRDRIRQLARREERRMAALTAANTRIQTVLQTNGSPDAGKLRSSAAAAYASAQTALRRLSAAGNAAQTTPDDQLAALAQSAGEAGRTIVGAARLLARIERQVRFPQANPADVAAQAELAQNVSQARTLLGQLTAAGRDLPANANPSGADSLRRLIATTSADAEPRLSHFEAVLNSPPPGALSQELAQARNLVGQLQQRVGEAQRLRRDASTVAVEPVATATNIPASAIRQLSRLYADAEAAYRGVDQELRRAYTRVDNTRGQQLQSRTRQIYSGLEQLRIARDDILKNYSGRDQLRQFERSVRQFRTQCDAARNELAAVKP